MEGTVPTFVGDTDYDRSSLINLALISAIQTIRVSIINNLNKNYIEDQ